MGKDYRTYREGCTHHVYSKAVDGNIIFYSVRDCIYYLTLYFHLAKRYKIITRAFCIMPNHIHSNEQAPSKKDFLLFHCRLTSEFSHGYNAEHNRKGSLFLKRFGFAPKTVGKRIRDNIAYIVNNPVVGNLSEDIEKYRWNLMAYRNTDHPFSEKIQLNKSSRKLRKALSLLNRYFSDDLPLDYTRQRLLFKGLSDKEASQLTDRIISMHNCINYDAVGNLYNDGIENAIKVIRANSGSEYDIPEDYEDYQAYNKMILLARKNGINLKTCNFEGLPAEELVMLAEQFSFAGFPAKQIRKFLHWSVARN